MYSGEYFVFILNNGKVLNWKWSEDLSKLTSSLAWCIFCFLWRMDIGYIITGSIYMMFMGLTSHDW